MKKSLIVFIIAIIAITAIVLGIVFSKKPEQSITPPVATMNIETLRSFAVFSQPIAADTIGFANFSPDGNYFFFSAWTNNAGNKTSVVNLENGNTVTLDAMAQRGFHNDSNYLTLFTPVPTVLAGNHIAIYDPQTDRQIKTPFDDRTYDLVVSPDGTRAVGNGKALSLLDVETGSVRVLDADFGNSGKPVWFSDSKRILGFKSNSENLFEAGRGRDLGIWNADTGEFTKISATFPVKSLRYIEWLVPDRVARVNAGYDDGSYDYLVNVETNRVIDLGETSWALMGGIVTDAKLGVMAAIGSGGAGDCMMYNECDGFIADQTGKIAEFQLPRDRHRSGLQIISKTKLLYISRDLGEEGGYGTTYVAVYDTETNQETRLQEVPNYNIVTLALSPNKGIWIVGAGKEFMVGEVK